MGADFGGYATKAGLKCSDGRTITPDAFKHMDGQKVPLVWGHMKDDPNNVLGHGVLEAREDGMYIHGYFNKTERGLQAKALLEHGDIESLSIFANQLVEKSKQVLHGLIHEVSLVLSGANPGAKIDFVRVAHSDGSYDELDDEAVIYTGLELDLEHADGDDDDDNDDDDGETVADVYETFNDKQKQVVDYLIGEALASKVESSDDDSAEHSANTNNENDEDSVEHSNTNDEGDSLEHQEGSEQMTRNVFDQTDSGSPKATLTHDQLQTIVTDARRMGSFKDSFLAHADEYGIDNIELLFPDAKAVTASPDFVKRRTEWVARVMDGTKHSPFARIKSLTADITADEARAKGYIKGEMKKEEFFGLAQRTTTPTTVYKKQKLDRDDIVDITEMDVVRWLWMEMRLMLDEELAAAILVGDGREVDDPDKIKDPEGASSGAGIRSIANDSDFYAPKVTFDSSDEDWTAESLLEAVVDALVDYEGSGSPVLFATTRMINKILFQKDTLGRRLYANRAEIVATMGVSGIVDIPETVMGRAPGVAGIIVNLQDYTVGTNAGGQISKFDDFDIDYNQYKYLLEGRCSGALTKYHSAVVLKDTAPATTTTTTTTTTVAGGGD